MTNPKCPQCGEEMEWYGLIEVEPMCDDGCCGSNKSTYRCMNKDNGFFGFKGDHFTSSCSRFNLLQGNPNE